MVEFALLTQDLRPGDSVEPADFDIAAQPGDIVLEGDASQNPVWDVVTRALRAIPPDGEPKRSIAIEQPRH
jgi:hypothetical protein